MYIYIGVVCCECEEYTIFNPPLHHIESYQLKPFIPAMQSYSEHCRDIFRIYFFPFQKDCS